MVIVVLSILLQLRGHRCVYKQAWVPLDAFLRGPHLNYQNVNGISVSSCSLYTVNYFLFTSTCRTVSCHCTIAMSLLSSNVKTVIALGPNFTQNCAVKASQNNTYCVDGIDMDHDEYHE